MYVKNLTNKDLIFNANGASIVLTANASTLIPDGLTTIQDLQKMFGSDKIILSNSGPSTTLLTNQMIASTGKLYMVDSRFNVADVRVYISGGTCDVAGSDNQNIPSTFASMACPEENQGVSGILSCATLPRYISFKTASGNPNIVITNCKLLEVRSIS